MARERTRCGWAGSDPLYVAYHDTEWGIPVHDDRKLYELLVLEGAQAGLSWITILRRREAYAEAFEGFDPVRVARFGTRQIDRLLKNEKIIRNRGKIESAVKNAKAFLAIQDEAGSFDTYQWGFVGGTPRQNTWGSLAEIPPKTPESEAFSKDLKRRGMTFVGPTIIYAHMQAVGMVNDHISSCFRHSELRGPGVRRERIRRQASR
jgi:DNA-3-methyladenine glycosylase I